MKFTIFFSLPYKYYILNFVKIGPVVFEKKKMLMHDERRIEWPFLKDLLKLAQ